MKAKKKPLAAKKLGDLGLSPSQVGRGRFQTENPGLDPAPGTQSRPDGFGRNRPGKRNDPGQTVTGRSQNYLVKEKRLWQKEFGLLQNKEGEPSARYRLNWSVKDDGLADQSGQPLAAVVVGHQIAEEAKKLAAYGADTLYVADAPDLAAYTPEAYTAVLSDLLKPRNRISSSGASHPGERVGRQTGGPSGDRIGHGLCGLPSGRRTIDRQASHVCREGLCRGGL